MGTFPACFAHLPRVILVTYCRTSLNRPSSLTLHYPRGHALANLTICCISASCMLLVEEQNWSEGTHIYRESFQKHLCGVQYTLRQEPRSEIVPHNWRALKGTRRSP